VIWHNDDMKPNTFEVVEKEPEDEGYFAYSPTLPGCTSNGLTIEEAWRNFREAIRRHVESLRVPGVVVNEGGLKLREN
jgi:predicted RNase H-like HicB family nuclease